MPLQILPALIEDIPRMVEIDRDAYTVSALDTIVFPQGRAGEVLEAQVAAERQSWQHNQFSIQTLKVVDTDLRDLPIAFARWAIRVEEEVMVTVGEKKSNKEGVPGLNREAYEEIIGSFKKKRMPHIGSKPHCYLNSLITAPNHQGRGAGKMLIQWGCNVADKHRVLAYVEASPVGVPIYEKCGFKRLEESVFDLRKWGKDETYSSWLMIRYPMI